LELLGEGEGGFFLPSSLFLLAFFILPSPLYLSPPLLLMYFKALGFLPKGKEEQLIQSIMKIPSLRSDKKLDFFKEDFLFMFSYEDRSPIIVLCWPCISSARKS